MSDHVFHVLGWRHTPMMCDFITWAAKSRRYRGCVSCVRPASAFLIGRPGWSLHSAAPFRDPLAQRESAAWPSQLAPSRAGRALAVMWSPYGRPGWSNWADWCFKKKNQKKNSRQAWSSLRVRARRGKQKPGRGPRWVDVNRRCRWDALPSQCGGGGEGGGHWSFKMCCVSHVNIWPDYSTTAVRLHKCGGIKTEVWRTTESLWRWQQDAGLEYSTHDIIDFSKLNPSPPPPFSCCICCICEQNLQLRFDHTRLDVQIKKKTTTLEHSKILVLNLSSCQLRDPLRLRVSIDKLTAGMWNFLHQQVAYAFLPSITHMTCFVVQGYC